MYHPDTIVYFVIDFVNPVQVNSLRALTIKTYQDGGEVVLAVQDMGAGIEPGLLEKLGTPFLTTKEKGTGLGLAICYGIAERHGAGVEVKSSPRGTTFYMRFRPAVD